jgi:membrane protease YdiL (CAAX protease family)
MSRALLISALVALFLFRGRLRLRAWWPRGWAAVRQAGFGLLLAAVSAQGMIGLYLAFSGFHGAHLPFGREVHALLTAVIAALIVPVLEETIFRGFLLTVLVEVTGRRVAWVLAAFIYAVAHFLRIPAQMAHQPLHWWSGAAGVISIFTNLGQGDFLTGRGLNLFLVGLILGGIFLRAGTLWVNAALHGGWILILMSFSAFTRPDDPPRISFLGGDLLGSPITTAVLLLLGFWLWRYYRRFFAEPGLEEDAAGPGGFLTERP